MITHQITPKPAPPVPTAAEAWQATRQQTALATQILADPDDYLAESKRDIGRQTGPNERELFVSCAPDLALQQQFEHLACDFIAVHDIATTASRKLLIGLAAAGKQSLQRLVIRRQGFGNVLAVLEFVELATADGGHLRLYATAAEADTTARLGLARVLLGYSRLAVAMVGDLPGHTIASMLQPFRETMLGGPWPNREVLLLPLSAGSSLAAQGEDLGRGTGVDVHTAPPVQRPADAWAHISASWNRVRGSLAGSAPALARLATPARQPAASSSAGPVQPVYPLPIDRATMRPMPPIPARAPAPGSAALAHYLRQVGALAGVASGCILEIAGGRCVAAHGVDPDPADLARQGASVIAAVAAAGRTLGMGAAPVDIAITLGSHNLVIRTLPGDPRRALHVALDKATANLTLVRLQLQRLDPLLDPNVPG